MNNIETILITGASSGIGKAFAYEFAKDNTTLILVARNKDAMEIIATDLRQKHNITVHVIPADLSIPGSAQKLYDTVIEQGLSIDTLVNNAGFGKWGYFSEYTPAVYAEMIQLNVTSLTELTRLFLPSMQEKGSGGILNVSSTGGLVPVPYAAVYGATKSYVLSFSEALYGELAGTGVTVTCLCPSGTKSNFSAVAGDNTASHQAALDDTDYVAKAGIKAYREKKSLVATGKTTWTIFLLKRLLPRTAVIKIAGDTFKKVVFANR